MSRRLFICVFLLASAAATPGAGVDGSRAVIRRDTYGVPHIWAPTEEEAAFAQGYAAAEDYFPLLARLFLRAKGLQASVFGEGALGDDIYMHQLGIHEVAESAFPTMPPVIRGLLSGYAGGYNLYLAQHRSSAPPWAKPVDGVDVLAHCRAVLLVDFFLLDRGFWASEDRQLALSNTTPPESHRLGSNMWLIGGSRTLSGRSMLLANPHVGWGGPYSFQEVQITVPGRINVSGATLIGFPVVGIGFNDYLGWSHTVNRFSSSDVYELTLDPADAAHYIYDGQSIPLTSRTIEIQVSRPDGAQTVKKTLWSCHYGPVVRTGPGKAYALKSADLNGVDFLTEWNLMAKSKSLAEFRSALNLQALPLFNVGYADRAGQIFYVFNGRIPDRIPGSPLGKPLAGDNSTTEWYSLVPVGSLPQILNPKNGYLQNCNDPPWYVNLAEHPRPADFPADMVLDTLGWRGQFSLDLLDRQERWDLAMMKRLKFDEHVIMAPRLKPDLVKLMREQIFSPRVVAAANLLDKWDDRASIDSRAALLFLRWWDNYERSAKPQFRVKWMEEDPVHTPTGLGDRKAALSSLTAAIKDLQSAYGSISPEWGEVHRFRRGNIDLPIGGAAGCFRTIGYHPEGDQKLVGDFGDSFVLAVEFTDSPTAYSVLAYSESSDAASPHFADQSRMFTQGEWKRVWFSEADIRNHTEREYHPGS
jgi:acyl-homoserine-lactone acylase